MIKISELSKTYNEGKDSKVNALSNVNIKFDSNGLVSILGKSGSGKSTLLNLIGGLDTPTSGSIEVDNVDVSSMDNLSLDSYRNSIIGFVFQEYNLFNDMTVYENISLAKELNNTNTDVTKILKSVDMIGFEDRLPNELSSGQRQRVAIARALAKDPKILLCDEPTGALDSDTGNIVMEILERISNDVLVIVVTHDKKSSAKYSGRVIEIKDGKIIDDSNPFDRDLNCEYMKMRPSKLSFMRILKIAVNNIRRRYIRAIFALMFSSIAFASFGISDSISSINRVDVTVKSMIESTINNTSLDYSIVKNAYGDKMTFTPGINYETNELLNENYPNRIFYPMYSNLADNLEDSLYFSIDDQYRNYYIPNISGSIEVNQEMMNNLGITLLHGRLPQTENEIMISLYTYELIEMFDLKDESNNKIEIENFLDLESKKITLANEEFTVVGVIDTGLDIDRYLPLIEMIDYSISRDTLQNELNTNLVYGLHSAIFVDDTYISIQDTKLLPMTEKAILEFEVVEQGLTGVSEDILYLYNVEGLISDNNFLYLKDNVNFNNLSSNQVILPISMLETIGFIDGVGDFRNLIHDKSYEIALNHSYSVFSDLSTEHTTFPFTTAEDYASYMVSGFENNYEEGLGKSYFKELALTDLFDQIYFDKFNELNLYHDYQGEEVSLLVEVVGFIDDSTIDLWSSKTLLVNNEMFESYSRRNDSNVKLLFTGINENDDDLRELIELHFINDNMYFRLNNEITVTIDYLGNSIQALSQIMLYVGLVVSIFSGYLLFNLISTSVVDKFKDIGILMALGTRRRDIYKIFLIQSTVIVVLNILLAITIMLIGNSVLNDTIRNDYGILIKIIDINIRQVLLVLSLSVGVSLVSTIIPLRKITKMNPVDAIRKDL